MNYSKIKNLKNENTIKKINDDLLCFSHLRWNFVYQRPQHLLSRFAKNGNRVFFIEEPVFTDSQPHLEISSPDKNIFIVVPQISHGAGGETIHIILASLIEGLMKDYEVSDFISWYYTPMMFPWSRHLKPLATIFDSMDELSLFKFAPPDLLQNEKDLLAQSDLVFTGGQSLFQAKKDRHPNVYAFPSSIDKAHFAKAFCITDEPSDQQEIPHPRIGFFGVIDERMDLELLEQIALLRPDFQLVIVGPVVKISQEDLPDHANIHYLGAKKYDELPAYLAGWDVAMMPFAMNNSTRFISPTKTPEYLAAGKPVISTPISDVVNPYGDLGLVQIAATAEEFAAAIEKALAEDSTERQKKVDEFLSDMSWDKTFEEMNDLISEKMTRNKKAFANSN